MNTWNCFYKTSNWKTQDLKKNNYLFNWNDDALWNWKVGNQSDELTRGFNQSRDICWSLRWADFFRRFALLIHRLVQLILKLCGVAAGSISADDIAINVEASHYDTNGGLLSLTSLSVNGVRTLIIFHVFFKS